MDIVTSAARSAKSMRLAQTVGLITSPITQMASAIRVVRNAIVTSIVISAVTLIPTMEYAINVAPNAITKCAASNLATSIAMNISNTMNILTKLKRDV